MPSSTADGIFARAFTSMPASKAISMAPISKTNCGKELLSRRGAAVRCRYMTTHVTAIEASLLKETSLMGRYGRGEPQSATAIDNINYPDKVV